MSIEVILPAALTATFVSGVFLLFNGWRDRKNRRKELLFNLAFKIAQEKTQLVWKIAEKEGRPATFKDTIYVAEELYRELEYFYERGELSQKAHDKLTASTELL